MDQRLARRRRAAIVAQHLHVRMDQAQRRAQVVRDRIRERLQLAIGDFQLGRALGDAALEIVIQDAHFVLDFRATATCAAIARATARSSSVKPGRPMRLMTHR